MCERAQMNRGIDGIGGARCEAACFQRIGVALLLCSSVATCLPALQLEVSTTGGGTVSGQPATMHSTGNMSGIGRVETRSAL